MVLAGGLFSRADIVMTIIYQRIGAEGIILSKAKPVFGSLIEAAKIADIKITPEFIDKFNRSYIIYSKYNFI